ncbi:MAG: carbohydrate porin [Thermoguttaceae bacterium]
MSRFFTYSCIILGMLLIQGQNLAYGIQGQNQLLENQEPNPAYGAQHHNELDEENLPIQSSTGLRFGLEQPRPVPPHSEGLLSELFPNLHGFEGVHICYLYQGGVYTNARGGYQTRNATTYNGKAELGLTVDTEKIGLWKNGTFYSDTRFAHGISPQNYVGDFQNTCTYHVDNPAQVSQYWYKHHFLDDRLRFKVGKQDAAVDFFFLSTTQDFLNTTPAYMPTSMLPRAPNNAWGAAGYYYLTDHLCVKAGAFDARPNGDMFWMSDAGTVYAPFQIERHYSLFGKLPGMFYLGGWYNSSRMELYKGGTVLGDNGFVGGMEQMLYRKNCNDPKDTRGIAFFAEYGTSNPDRNILRDAYTLGFTWKGFWDCRPKDSIGLSANTVRFSFEYLSEAHYEYSFETAYEFYYQIKISDNFFIQPDLQYIVHPAANYEDSLMPALVFQAIF